MTEEDSYKEEELNLLPLGDCTNALPYKLIYLAIWCL